MCISVLCESIPVLQICQPNKTQVKCPASKNDILYFPLSVVQRVVYVHGLVYCNNIIIHRIVILISFGWMTTVFGVPITIVTPQLGVYQQHPLFLFFIYARTIPSQSQQKTQQLFTQSSSFCLIDREGHMVG